ncbi:MAG: VanW family protein [Pseudoflavonifractor sp.]
MARALFCQSSPVAYRLSVLKCQLQRRISDGCSGAKFAGERAEKPLPFLVYKSSSLIRRRLGDVDMELQENKATNLALAAPKVTELLIRPGETFSFWHLVGDPCAKRGYREGLTIANGSPCRGIGGGMCQMTNLIHWLVLHSPLLITEHHHHDGYDLFPDFNRKIPFGTGTSIMYNYLDYRFYNDSACTYELVLYSDGDYLSGELRTDKKPLRTYHITAENQRFVREGDLVYREGEVWRSCIDVNTGNQIFRERIRKNHAKVCYDTAGLTISPS